MEKAESPLLKISKKTVAHGEGGGTAEDKSEVPCLCVSWKVTTQ